MTGADSVQMASYELSPLPKPVAPDVETDRQRQSLPESILRRNVLWFCQFRWIVVAVLLGFGVLGLGDGVLRRTGLLAPGLWPFVVAVILLLCNTVYVAHAHSMRLSKMPNGWAINLWVQIILDLLILTAVVHFLGSIRTYIPFTYLFHIVLSCVFFSRRQSLTVVVLASALFGACVIAESLGIIETVHIFANGHTAPYAPTRSVEYALNLPSAMGIWLVVWYLVSYLSKMVRTRDIELAETNRRLMAAQEERSRHMLTMTHQLKAPFAAIHANVQLLLKGHCGALSDEALGVARRIAARSRRLATEIQEMLQLANLSSSSQEPPQSVELELSEVLNWCVEQVQPLAQEHEIALDVDIRRARTRGIEDHLKMLFGNLLSNAVLYSRKGGRVGVGCRREHPSESIVTISDEGIGIAPNKLSSIFNEHYRTKEAVRHNKESSGLGLAIVRHITQLHGIHLRVQSQPETGTTFTLRFPCDADDPPAPGQKELQNGLSHDC